MKTSVTILGVVIWFTLGLAQSCFSQDRVKASTDAQFCTDTLPDCFPIWRKASSRSVKQEQLDLFTYCQKLETSLDRAITQDPEWKPSLSQAALVFFVDHDGAIKDVFAYESSDTEAADIIKGIVLRAGKLGVAPSSILGRRIALNVKYPKIKVYVDMNDPAKDAKHFEKLKSRAKNI